MLPIAQIENGEQQNENQNVAMTVNLVKEEQPVRNETEAPAAPANNSVFIAEEEEEEEKVEFISIKKSSPSSPSLLHSEVLLSRRARLIPECSPASCLRR